jgi:hypothetical protein
LFCEEIDFVFELFYEFGLVFKDLVLGLYEFDEVVDVFVGNGGHG